MKSKYTIQELLGVGMTLVVLGVGIAYGINVMVDVRDDFTAGTQEYMAIQNTTAGLGKLTEKTGTIATIVVASVIIGILLTYLWGRFAR